MKNILLKISSFCNKIFGFIIYHMTPANMQSPYKLVGEKKTQHQNEIIVIYQIRGKRNVFEIPIRELMNSPSILAKFHPLETSKIGAIAMGEVLCRQSTQEQRIQKFNEIKEKMLEEA